MILKGYARFRSRHNRGSVLILVFWALILLATFAVYMGSMVRQRLDLVRRTHDYAALRMASEAGAYYVKAELVSSCGDVGSGELHDWLIYSRGFDGQMKSGPRYVVHVVDLERRLNINTAPREVMARLFKNVAEVSSGEAQSLSDAIIDWRDADHEMQPSGAEDLYYQSLSEPYEAKDELFNSTEELLLVRGFAGKIYDRVAPYVTVCGAGAVNINTATAPVLLSLNLSPLLVEKIATYLKGEDGEFGTEDDEAFGAPFGFDQQAKDLVIITPDEEKELEALVEQGLLNVVSRNFFVMSRGTGSPMIRSFVTRAIYSVMPSEQGGCSVRLVWWRTGE